MNYWKTLFKKPDPMAKEISMLEALDAISAQPQKEAYWWTLHPLVQAYCQYLVGWEHENELPFTVFDARKLFTHWGYPAGDHSPLSPQQEELAAWLEPQKDALWHQVQEAERRLREMDDEAEKKREEGWKRYWAHYETLPQSTKSLVLWELAKRGASRGRSGFHGDFFKTDPFPFTVCGWATYPDPRWTFGDAWGVAFRINKACFGSRKPLLYYLDDDNWPWEELDLELMRKYSSGIANVRAERRRCVGWGGEEGMRQVVLFELDRAAVKETVSLGGKNVPTREVGDYILVLPRAGEFYCLLGEVRDGAMIPLRKDDFCMK